MAFSLAVGQYSGRLYAMLREDPEAIFQAVTAWVPDDLTRATIDALEPEYVRGETA